MGLSELSFSATNINVGLDADKPINPRQGDIYVANDTKRVLVCYVKGKWRAIADINILSKLFGKLDTQIWATNEELSKLTGDGFRVQNDIITLENYVLYANPNVYQGTGLGPDIHYDVIDVTGIDTIAITFFFNHLFDDSSAFDGRYTITDDTNGVTIKSFTGDGQFMERVTYDVSAYTGELSIKWVVYHEGNNCKQEISQITYRDVSRYVPNCEIITPAVSCANAWQSVLVNMQSESTVIDKIEVYDNSDNSLLKTIDNGGLITDISKSIDIYLKIYLINSNTSKDMILEAIQVNSV